eukprot:TRINITY_DN5029_c0_g1_i1.p1 TRINITY_DN5029_c0_g1~~TRINITY_DN5029_c0_g1_i1.p1  ORF type:complete len:717 (+),score=195.87 TRINITY_DN5029_c0_g1_i1:208-2358(+)
MDKEKLEALDKEAAEYFKEEDESKQRDRAVKRVRLTLNGLARRLGVEGEVRMFGSFSNGFKTGTSDLDVVLVADLNADRAVGVLQKFALAVEMYGFSNVTKIFQANVPLVKFTDVRSGIEVDFCINNNLGVRNSLLLLTYCNYDKRALQVGRMIKDWAKRREIVGTADGYLNSYAYMLLTIYYMQSLQPPVLPNLQAMAIDPVYVQDNKWGCEDRWDTKFVEDIEGLARSENTQTVAELVSGFLQFYSEGFNWRQNAVSMRLNRSGGSIDKFSLATSTNEEQWYIEDPFDLKHNLAGKCTRAGRKRILEEMRRTYEGLANGGSWEDLCGEGPQSFFLKCRITENVSPHALLETFEDFDVTMLHYPKEIGGRMAQAFLEFDSAANRRQAHTRNETYVADVQLMLHYSSRQAKDEASANLKMFDMANYKMQREVHMKRQQRIATVDEESYDPSQMSSAGQLDQATMYGMFYQMQQQMGPGSPEQLRLMISAAAGHPGAQQALARLGVGMPGADLVNQYRAAGERAKKALEAQVILQQIHGDTSSSVSDDNRPPAKAPPPPPPPLPVGQTNKIKNVGLAEANAKAKAKAKAAQTAAAAQAGRGAAQANGAGAPTIEINLDMQLPKDWLSKFDAKATASLAEFLQRFVQPEKRGAVLRKKSSDRRASLGIDFKSQPSPQQTQTTNNGKPAEGLLPAEFAPTLKELDIWARRRFPSTQRAS